MKKVLITGITGQLGAFLSKLYLTKGYEVIGSARRSANFNPWRLKVMGTLDKVSLEYMDLADQSSIDVMVNKHKPDLLINTAGQSYVGSSWVIGEYTLDVTGVGVYRCLEAIRKFSPHTRFLQMSSSEMFGDNPNVPYNERSLFMPRSPYGVAKACGYYLVTNFRQSYGLFASNLVSFNFESSLRGPEFVTKKIVENAVRIYNELEKSSIVNPLHLGNMSPTRDWIWAGDTANAISLILEHNEPDDFCIGSGVTTSVKEFCDKAFSLVNCQLEWHTSDKDGVMEYAVDKYSGEILVESLKELYRPADVPHLISDASKARNVLGWKPTKTLEEIIQDMISFEFNGKLNYEPNV